MFNRLTYEQFMQIPTGNTLFLDVECYPNAFCVMMKVRGIDGAIVFERTPDTDFNELELKSALWRHISVGFNSNSYDMFMIELACKGLSCTELKEASDYIINSGIRFGTKKVGKFEVEKTYKVKIPTYNHIDLYPICPVNNAANPNSMPSSLKLYAARLHTKKMQDLPYNPDLPLSREMWADIVQYCYNDLENTELLYNKLKPEIELRERISKEYETDLRSKSDAQIAEAVVKKRFEKLTGKVPERAKDIPEFVTYEPPSYINFENKLFQQAYEIVKTSKFYLDGNGSPILPEALTKLNLTLGQSCYKLGMGGLHSTEKSIAHYASNLIKIADNDVESYYPRIILNNRLFPKHLGELFLKVYEDIVNERIYCKNQAKEFKDIDKAKAKAFKEASDILKIVINGLFGKFGNLYSVVFSPELMLFVTLTGQLSLMMLIERLEEDGFSVISANTDGIISKYLRSDDGKVRSIISEWEQECGFKTEETEYLATFNRDVNNYIAVKINDEDTNAEYLDMKLGIKTKGCFCERGSALNSVLSKNPEALICTDAVLHYIKHQIPIEETIKNCKDVRRFVTIKNVKGGATQNGIYLGKTIRFYQSVKSISSIRYASNGNKVGGSDFSTPLMELPETLPEDINYKHYIDKTIEMMYDCGILKHEESEILL